MSSSWWQKKLGGQPPTLPGPAQAPRQPSRYAPVLPPGMGQDPAAVVNRYLEQNQLMQEPQAPQMVPTATGLQMVGAHEAWVPENPMAPVNGLASDPYGYHRRLWGWTGDPRGGAGETQNTGNCPNCGSPRFFSRAFTSVINSNTGQQCTPRPECFECGYPNDQGVLAAQAGGAKRMPGVKESRQFDPRQGLAPDGSAYTLIRV